MLERLKILPEELYSFSEGTFSGVSSFPYISPVAVLASWRFADWSSRVYESSMEFGC